MTVESKGSGAAGDVIGAGFSDRRCIFGLVLLALALRLLWAWIVPIAPESSDPKAYDALAWNLATTNEYGWAPGARVSHWPPGASFLYSLAYRIFGHVYPPIALINALLGAGLVLMAAVLAQRWFGRQAARWAALLLAVWPGMIQYTTLLASELPSTFLLVGAVLLHDLWSTRTAGTAALKGLATGTVVGAATYVRVEILLLPAVLALSWRIAGRRLGLEVLTAALALATAFVLVAPWCIRNTHLHGQVAFLSTSVGADLWMGNKPDSTGGYVPIPELPGLSYIEKEHFLRDEAMRFVAEDPIGFVVRSLYKAVRMHDSDTTGIHWNADALERVFSPALVTALKLATQAFWLVLLAGAGAGAILLLRSRRLAALGHPTLAFWAYITAVHAVAIALQDRFHFPINPFLAILTGHALGRALERSERRPATAR
jgi:4-amino-4-deoxy-L-arabinose transferase-like glycosyltransferase